MAVHTGLSSRNVRMVSILHVRVAVLAVQTNLTYMQPVAVCNRLFRGITNVCELRGKEVPNE